MRFEELDTRLRAFETNDDHCVLPDLHIVVLHRDLELPVGDAYGTFVEGFIC